MLENEDQIHQLKAVKKSIRSDLNQQNYHEHVSAKASENTWIHHYSGDKETAPSVFKYMEYLQSAGYDVYLMDVISPNQELISDDW